LTQVLHREGDAATCIHVIKSGEIRLTQRATAPRGCLATERSAFVEAVDVPVGWQPVHIAPRGAPSRFIGCGGSGGGSGQLIGGGTARAGTPGASLPSASSPSTPDGAVRVLGSLGKGATVGEEGMHRSRLRYTATATTTTTVLTLPLHSLSMLSSASAGKLMMVRRSPSVSRNPNWPELGL
jgi:CRP-like cAMP-binding protein